MKINPYSLLHSSIHSYLSPSNGVKGILERQRKSGLNCDDVRRKRASLFCFFLHWSQVSLPAIGKELQYVLR